MVPNHPALRRPIAWSAQGSPGYSTSLSDERGTPERGKALVTEGWESGQGESDSSCPRRRATLDIDDLTGTPS